MLNWDDYNQDDSNNLAAQTPAPAVVAAAVATEHAAEETTVPAAAAIATKDASVTAMKAAEAAVANMDASAGIEELEIGAARV